MASDRPQTEKLLRQAQALEPTSPRWPEEIAQVYHLDYLFNTGKERQSIAAKSLAELEKAYSLTSPSEQVYMLGGLAATAVEAGQSGKAQSYATQAIKSENADGLFYGSLALGRLALRAGDRRKAGEYLLAAGRAPSSPVRVSFGPNMLLAKELLDAGERDVVLQYLDLCGKFWTSDKDKLAEWKDAIDQGTPPDFGANLTY